MLPRKRPRVRSLRPSACARSGSWPLADAGRKYGRKAALVFDLAHDRKGEQERAKFGSSPGNAEVITWRRAANRATLLMGCCSS